MKLPALLMNDLEVFCLEKQTGQFVLHIHEGRLVKFDTICTKSQKLSRWDDTVTAELQCITLTGVP